MPKLILLFFICICCITRQSMAGITSYGNYCGAGHGGEALEPKDKLDGICCAHDTCCSIGGNYKLEIAGKSLGTFCTNYCSAELKKQSEILYNDLDCSKHSDSKACNVLSTAIVYAATNQAGAGAGQEIIEVSKKVNKCWKKTIKSAGKFLKSGKVKTITECEDVFTPHKSTIDKEVKAKMSEQTCQFNNWQMLPNPKV